MAEAQDAQAGALNHKKKSGANLPVILSTVALGVAIAAGGAIGYQMFVAENQQTAAIGQFINKKISALQTQAEQGQGFDESTMAQLNEVIADEVVNQIESQFKQTTPEMASRIKNDVIVYFEQNSPVNKAVAVTPKVDTNLIVNAVINKLRTSPSLDIKATDSYARNKIKTLSDEVEGAVESIQALESRAATTVAQTATAKVNTPPKRLKEFNIIAPMPDGKFAINAPTKQGEPNLVTLEVGEPFRSKYGSHKVLAIQKSQDNKVRLMISGNYFIDTMREEFTTQELAAFKASKTNQKKNTPVPAKKKGNYSASQPQQLAQMVELKDWYVVTTKPTSKEVVVYNPISQAPIRLSKNTYVEGVGTVRNIDFRTGTTQFEKYFIRGAK